MSVLDKNGIEIRVGDTVQDLSDGQESVVTRVEEHEIVGYSLVYCKWNGRNTETWTNPVNLTVVGPREKLTWERRLISLLLWGYTVTITKKLKGKTS